MSNRKEEILTAALHLFARDGYEAVSVSQIAGELDMTKGALYRHYKSKRDIFDCIVERMEQGDSNQAAEHDMPEDDKESRPESTRQCHWRNLSNIASQCLHTGRRTISHRRFERCSLSSSSGMKRCRDCISSIWRPVRSPM